ncbi:MAG: hypothetical protein Tsb002_04590 [Wenzhouxiangellaceae bacterium]
MKREGILSVMITGAMLMSLSLPVSAQNIQLHVTNQQRLVAHIQTNDLLIRGSGLINAGLLSLPVDALIPAGVGGQQEPDNSTSSNNNPQPSENEGGTGTPDFTLISDWGELYLSIDCGEADLILYRNNNGVLEEALVDRVPINLCLQ